MRTFCFGWIFSTWYGILCVRYILWFLNNYHQQILSTTPFMILRGQIHEDDSIWTNMVYRTIHLNEIRICVSDGSKTIIRKAMQLYLPIRDFPILCCVLFYEVFWCNSNNEICLLKHLVFSFFVACGCVSILVTFKWYSAGTFYFNAICMCVMCVICKSKRTRKGTTSKWNGLKGGRWWNGFHGVINFFA